MLCHPRTSITADALKIAIAIVLEQHKPLGCEPWLAFDHDLLASIRAIRHFRHMVERAVSSPCTPTMTASSRHSAKTANHSRHARRTSSRVSPSICYLEGKANVAADQLSLPTKKIHQTNATIDAPFPDNKTEELWKVISSIDS